MSIESIARRTVRASHGNTPREWEEASRWIAKYTAAMFFEAGRGPGRANGALIAALRAGESFDMVAAAMGGKERGRNGRKRKRNTTIEIAREDRTTRFSSIADIKTQEEVTVNQGRRSSASASRFESAGLCDPWPLSTRTHGNQKKIRPANC